MRSHGPVSSYHARRSGLTTQAKVDIPSARPRLVFSPLRDGGLSRVPPWAPDPPLVHNRPWPVRAARATRPRTQAERDDCGVRGRPGSIYRGKQRV